MGWYTSPVQPMPTKISEVAISVAIVIPEMGLEEEPIKPTMRDDTVTKKKPNTTIITAERKLVGMFGIMDIKTTSATLPTNTYTRGISLSVRDFTTALSLRLSLRSLKESRKALIIVGNVFINVISPPKVTAPAPM